MRKLLAILVLFIASQGWAAIAHQTGTGTPHATNTSTSTSCVITYTPHAAGDAIVFNLMVNGSISAQTLSDNVSSSYTVIGTSNVGGSTAEYLWIALSVNSGATTFTASWTTGKRNSCDLTEYSGVVGWGGTFKTNTNNTGTTQMVLSTLSTTQPNSWTVLAGGSVGTGTYSAGTGCSPTATCTLEDSVAGASTTPGSALTDDGNVASSGTTVTLQTNISASQVWTAMAFELLSQLPACTKGQIAMLGAGCG